MNASAILTMSLDEAIRRRRSVRGFLPREVPLPTLREVFDLAQCTPSNGPRASGGGRALSPLRRTETP